MANDKAKKTCEAFPLTKEIILASSILPWYQGSYFSDKIAPQPIAPEMRQRMVETCEKLFDKKCLQVHGTILRVPFVTILPHDHQYPRMVLVFKKDVTELRENDQLLGRRYEEPLIASWDANEPNIAQLVEEIVKAKITAQMAHLARSAQKVLDAVTSF